MPDFGIFRGFNEKLFGDKLYAGQLPINLGLIGSGNFTGVDIDALAFFTRVTAAGGTLSATEQSAIDTLVKQMKNDGIWTKMKAIYPMVGASAAACAQNLKSSSFTNSFSGGWTFSSTGATPNGTNAFYNTLLNLGSEFSVNNVSFGFYSGTSGVQSATIAMGCNTGSSFSRLYPNHPGDQIYCDINDLSTVVMNSQNRSDGFIFGYRVSSTQKKISRRGTIQSFTSPSSALINLNFYLGGTNSNGNAVNLSIFQHRFAFIGETITDTEADAYYTAVQAFQTTLGRAIAP
jgi:hypothetical protein